MFSSGKFILKSVKNFSFFFLSFAHVLGKDAKHHTYPQPTLLKMLQESTPEPSLKSSLGPLSAEETGLLFDLTSFTFVLIFSSIVQVRGKKVKSFQCLKGKLHNKQTI